MEKEIYLADDFEFAQKDDKIHDLKFDTKPIGYFKDAWIRFRKSKAAVFGGIVILLVVLYAIITPLVSSYDASFSDGTYINMVPWSKTLSSLHIADGTYSKELNPRGYTNLLSIGIAAEDKDGHSIDVNKGVASVYNPVKSVNNVYTKANGTVYRSASVHQYYEVGFKYVQLQKNVYEDIKAFEAEKGIQVIYPMVDTNKIESYLQLSSDANYWYKTIQGYAVDENGARITTLEGLSKLQSVYLTDSNGDIAFYKIGGSDGTMYTCRVLYYNYYLYKNNMLEPYHLMGTDTQG